MDPSLTLVSFNTFSGEANLRDLKLRREALDKLDLPIDVLEGIMVIRGKVICV